MYGPIHSVIFDFEGTLVDRHLHPFAGIDELLESLKSRGLACGICTGGRRQTVLGVLEAQGWLPRFFMPEDLLCADDGFPSKPDPAGLTALLHRKGLVAERTLMVGDQPTDMRAGRAAGCKTAAALWDPSQEEGLTERARFRSSWTRWPTELSDVRLISPQSLKAWICSED